MADGTDKKRKKTKASKTNWIAWGIAIVVLYVGGFLWIIGPQAILSFFNEKTKELNNIGDFLAGVFAFPAFVLLATAVLTQRQELNETREQFEDAKEVTEVQLKLIHEQNGLSHRAAQANYKLAMHEKRLSVYFRLKECAGDLMVAGTIDPASRKKIWEAADDAIFIFGNEVIDYVKELRRNSSELAHTGMKITYHEKKQRSVGLNKNNASELEGLMIVANDIDRWFMENLTYEVLEHKFTPALKLPADIQLDN